ncbi:MAG: hypothetical protein VKL41_10510 [Snowella sp.]|nr:hypothetical protein [Snowella sp.]
MDYAPKIVEGVGVILVAIADSLVGAKGKLCNNVYMKFEGLSE